MFEGVGNEIIQVSEYYLNHPMTKLGLILFAIIFIATAAIIIGVFLRIFKDWR